jgi:methoxymalonate biosynthesis acyl carrier protein
MIDKQGIRDFLKKLAGKDLPVEDDESLLAGRLVDSLKVVELIVFLENQYGVKFDLDELAPSNLDTINAIVGLLERKGIT